MTRHRHNLDLLRDRFQTDREIFFDKAQVVAAILLNRTGIDNEFFIRLLSTEGNPEEMRLHIESACRVGVKESY